MLDLFPRPRRFELRGAGAPLDAAARETLVDTLPPQGYELTIEGGDVTIRHADDAGLRYARSTLDQIRAQSSGGLPGVHVTDHPDFPHRAYMLDVSRDRVPTRETLERIVGILALARINQLQLYTEHTFAYEAHEIVWENASPITPEDVRWLDAVCIEHGIELVANQNCFGHMNRWLVHPEYRDRAECPDGAKAPWGADLPPWTLEPTPRNAAFAIELFDELLPNFTSKRVNIGCDEPFDLGQGRSAGRVAQEGKTFVYLEHLVRLTQPLVERGYEVQVWGDILREDPGLAQKMLPDGVVAVPWHYEQPWPAELLAQVPQDARDALAQLDVNPAAGFRPHVEPLADLSMPYWLAPGTATWNSLIGRVDNALGNLRDAAQLGREFGAGGYLITDWGDNGHHQPPSVSWGPLVYGGAVSWCHDTNHDMDVAAVLDAHVFGDSAGILGATLDRLGVMWRQCGQLAFNGSPIFRGLVPRSTMSFGEIDARRCQDTADALDECIAAVGMSSPSCADASVVRDELVAASRLAMHGVWRMVRHTNGDTTPDDDAMHADLAEAIELQHAAWLARSRPGGLPDSLERLERTLATYVA